MTSQSKTILEWAKSTPADGKPSLWLCRVAYGAEWMPCASPFAAPSLRDLRGKEYLRMDERTGEHLQLFVYDQKRGEYVLQTTAGTPAIGAGRAEASKKQINADGTIEIAKHSHYFFDVRGYASIDVYRLLELARVTDPVLQHITKKALCAGKRGAKDFRKDLEDIRDSAMRRLAMLDEDDARDEQ